MIYKDRTYRNTEETSTSEQTLEGRLAALDNFSGGGSATAEIREELKLSTPEPVVEKLVQINYFLLEFHLSYLILLQVLQKIFHHL